MESRFFFILVEKGSTNGYGKLVFQSVELRELGQVSTKG